MQYNTIQYMYNTIQCNAIQYNKIQYNVMQCNTIQYNTMQCNNLMLVDNVGKIALIPSQGLMLKKTLDCKENNYRTYNYVSVEIITITIC